MNIANLALDKTNQAVTRNSASTTGNPQDAASQKNLFMSLLVAQLKNQDPLSPQDGTEFVAQLAQFNSLDQLVQIKESIQALSNQLQQNSNTNRNQ